MKKAEYKWSGLHAKVFDRFIRELNVESIRYFILRNYEGLPNINESKDIDLIIEPGKYDHAAQLLLQVFEEYKIEYYYVVKYERVRCWFGMNASDDFAIHIDLIEGYINKGFEIFEFEKLYNNTVKYKEYDVLNQPYDIAMLLLYKVIGAKELKDRYRDKISVGYKQCCDDVKEILVDVLGNDLAVQVCSRLDSNDYEWIVQHSSEISKISKKIAFRKHPLNTVKCVVEFLVEKMYRIVICPPKFRKMIALEAPDGTGKSTFIDTLAVKLAETFVCDIEKVHVYHFRPSLLPNLGEVGEKAGVMKQDTDFENPHRNKPANPISSFVRLIYYWLDYVIGDAICIRKDVQFDRITIFDRYIYDFIVDPLRSRIALPRSVRVLFSKIVQRPQIVFVLNAPAEVIYKRKQELTIDEIARQQREFERLMSMGDYFFMIDANQPPEKMVQDARKIILSKFCNRMEKRG